MTNIERYNGEKEFSILLKRLPVVPSNTEIVEKTGVSKASVSRIMNGLRTPSKSFVEKFKKGFNIIDQNTPIEKEKPPSQDSGLKDKLIQILESSLKRVEDELQRVLAENERLKNK